MDTIAPTLLSKASMLAKPKKVKVRTKEFALCIFCTLLFSFTKHQKTPFRVSFVWSAKPSRSLEPVQQCSPNGICVPVARRAHSHENLRVFVNFPQQEKTPVFSLSLGFDSLVRNTKTKNPVYAGFLVFVAPTGIGPVFSH